KLLKDLKELAEYDQSTSTDRPIFLNDNEDHLVQNKESPENSSEETVFSKTNQEPPQDSDIHQLIEEFAPIQSTKEPEHLLSMRYEHLSITPEPESDEVTESNVENLLSIPSKCEVTLEDEIECDMPAKDDCSLVFTTFSNPLFKVDDNFDSSDDESLPDEDVPAKEFKIYSNPLCDEDKINSDKLDPLNSLISNQKFQNPTLILKKKSVLLRICFMIIHFYDRQKELNAKIADTIIESIPLPISVQDGNSQQEEIDIVTETDDVLPPSIENFADDPEGDFHFLEELLIDDSILSDELSDANFEENPLILRPPPKPPDVETNAGEEILVVMNDKDKDVDYSSFIFVIYPEMFLFLLSAESEDTIFDPGNNLIISITYRS
nr:hypothetical protein [Tanacetum cinerariifolium]